MPRKLKVFRTPIGFHDAYVAASSRKAALAAWGSDADLFARGAAEEVTDPALMADALAHPGEVVRRSRGTAAEQLGAIPEKQRSPKRPDRPAPRPSRAKVDAADDALDDMERRHRAADVSLAKRQAALDREKRALAKDQAVERATLEEARERARADYDAALRRWRG